MKPLLLAARLGAGALRPPPSSIEPPDLSGLEARKPTRLPDGSPVPARLLAAEALERLDPKLAGAGADRRRSGHWESARPLWHDGPARGLAGPLDWQWLWKEGERWWAARAPDVPWLRWGRLWWGKRRGVWFVQHAGEAWAWRRFSDWDAEGLIRLRDGVQIVYSADFTRVAVLEPGAGAVLYDAATGSELGRWTEEELPRRRPTPPSSLRLPRGI